MTPGVDPVCLGRRQFGCKGSPDLHMAITGTKAEPAFIGKRNRSPLRPPMSSGLTPLASQTAMAWSLWNARYRAPGMELTLK
ncbi:uncharacterized protein TNCV_924301 [Trichonephila clavipes]|nr:uncharacterized protein TNCV_924301 [Trichonephila clavipes]